MKPIIPLSVEHARFRRFVSARWAIGVGWCGWRAQLGFETMRRTAEQRGRPIGVGAPEGIEGPGCGAHGWRKNGNWGHRRYRGDTKVAHQEPRRATPGAKLAQHESYSRTSGTKLTQQTPSHRMRGTKLALLAQNGPFWHVFRMHGELCTVFARKKPSMANFIPHARQRWV